MVNNANIYLILNNEKYEFYRKNSFINTKYEMVYSKLLKINTNIQNCVQNT